MRAVGLEWSFAALAAGVMLAVAPGARAQSVNEIEPEVLKSGDAGGETVYVTMSTSKGEIVLELDGEKAPISVENFLAYAAADHYDGTIFHRVMPNFVVQGGGFTADLAQKPVARDPIENEWENGLKNARGTIAMARLGRQPDSATCQFFINVRDNDVLDVPRDGAGYAVFGRVIAGMEVVDEIRGVQTETKARPDGNRMANVPVEPVVIEDVARLDAGRGAELAAREAERRAEREARERAEREVKLKQQFEAAMSFLTDEQGLDVSGGEKTDSGLWILHAVEGEGESPSASSQVTIHYTGWLTDGTMFDSSYERGQPAAFPLGRLIQGWIEGVPMMKTGGTSFFVIPYELAYGKAGRPGAIPPESTLVFKIELISFR